MMMLPSTLSRGTLGVRMEGPLPKHTERAFMLGTNGCMRWERVHAYQGCGRYVYAEHLLKVIGWSAVLSR